ncbi:MAG: hypothetical protein FJ087_09890, partial [Deltaproteobacteria bacterium]|nr:hypothetical protein [Deltaproteobacteria bacterium]
MTGTARARRRPRLSLKVRFAAILALVLVLLGVANHAWLDRRVHRAMERDLDGKALVMARYLAAESVDLLLYQDLVRLHELLAKAVASSPSHAYAYIMDPAGGAVAHTFQGAFPEELGASNRLAPAEPWREGHIRALGP